MNRATRATQFLLTAGLAVTASTLAFLSARILAGMYLNPTWSLMVAMGAAFVPGYLLNKVLTASYRRLESGASEWGSIFGCLLLANATVLPVAWVGLAGVPAGVAVQQAIDDAAYAVGLLEQPSERTLATFPVAEVDTGVVWVPNVGTKARPRVIARQADGTLKAVVLPPRGESLKAKTESMVGPHDTGKDAVMLAPVPEDPARNRRIVEVDWSGGRVRFVMDGGNRSAHFTDR